MTYQTNDRKIVHGDTPAAVVEALRAHAWMRETHTDAYMQAVATRVKEWNDADIRHDGAANFLTDLGRCQLLTRLS